MYWPYSGRHTVANRNRQSPLSAPEPTPQWVHQQRRLRCQRLQRDDPGTPTAFQLYCWQEASKSKCQKEQSSHSIFNRKEVKHTCLEAPIGVKKFAKDANPLGPFRGSIQSILGHFWNFATTGFQDLSWFLSRISVFMPKHVFKGPKTQNDSLECCLEWKNTHLLQVWCNFIHNCGF